MLNSLLQLLLCLDLQSVLVREIRFFVTTKAKSATLTNSHMLIINLASADMLMGVYLVLLEAASLKFHNSYCSNDHIWRASGMCSAMGILVVLSTETSVVTMALLTALRLYAVLKASSFCFIEAWSYETFDCLVHCITIKGVTRLDGARGKKQVWRPHVWTWALSEANVLYWRKYLWQWNFLVPPSHLASP